MRTDGSGVSPEEESSERAAAFRSESDFTMNRFDQLRELYDRKLYAPLQVVLNDYRGVFGVSVMAFYLLMGTVGVAIYPEPVQSSNFFMPWFQSMQYPLGTDGAGRGLLAMIIHATPAMLQLMLGGSLFTIMMAVAVGTVAGYKRGMTDRVLMTITDTLLTLPGLPLLIVIVSVLEPTNPFLIGVILSINAWGGGARSLRGQVLSTRNADYVEATRAMGISTGRNIQKNILPELLPLLALSFMTSLVGIIFAAVGLYYLGILPVARLNWGVMLNSAQEAMDFVSFKNGHYLAVVLITLSLFGIGTVYTAQAFDRVFNPRLRARYAKTIRGGDGGDDDDEVADVGSVEAMAR